MNNPTPFQTNAGTDPTQTVSAGWRHRFLVTFLALVAGTSPALAFPPAPTFTIHGIARDPFGWALKSTDQGTVVIKRNGAVIVEAPIDDTSRPGENFRALLPMDTNAADPYRAGAQTAGVSFTIEVRFPTVTMLISSLTASQRTIGQPAGMLFVDFTVGVDSDGDGIPDAWEWWQLGEMGIGPGDPRWTLATLGTGDFDHDGTSDYVEYLAGTFAFLADDSLRLAIDGFAPDGSAQLRALVVVEKTYRIESSNDLQTWTTASVRVGAPGAVLTTNYAATDTREVAIYAPISGAPTERFYRLTLVR